MKFAKYLVPVSVLSLGLVLSTTTSFAKPEFAKKEKKTCTYCHVKMGSKDLNDTGKYYKDHNNSLEGYEEKK